MGGYAVASPYVARGLAAPTFIIKLQRKQSSDGIFVSASKGHVRQADCGLTCSSYILLLCLEKSPGALMRCSAA